MKDYLVGFVLVLSSLFTLGILNNGSAGEYPVMTRASIFLPIYAIGMAVICLGLLQLFEKLDRGVKVFYMYLMVFFAYLLASFAMYLSSQTVSISLT